HSHRSDASGWPRPASRSGHGWTERLTSASAGSSARSPGCSRPTRPTCAWKGSMHACSSSRCTSPENLDLVIACAEHLEGSGLVPILGHPERCDLVYSELGGVARLRRRGWLTQVNASSLMGRHGREVREAAWALVETGDADLVGSDGHRA